jgi:hypothetical protein
MVAKQTPKRPFGVTVLLGLVLTFTGLQILRVWVSVANWDFLNSLPLQINPLFFIISGLFWAAVGAMLATGLWTRRRGARLGVLLATLGYVAFHWADRLWLQARGPQSSNLVFDAVLSVVMVVFIAGMLAPASMRNYFRSE